MDFTVDYDIKKTKFFNIMRMSMKHSNKNSQKNKQEKLKNKEIRSKSSNHKKKPSVFANLFKGSNRNAEKDQYKAVQTNDLYKEIHLGSTKEDFTTDEHGDFTGEFILDNKSLRTPVGFKYNMPQIPEKNTFLSINYGQTVIEHSSENDHNSFYQSADNEQKQSITSRSKVNLDFTLNKTRTSQNDANPTKIQKFFNNLQEEELSSKSKDSNDAPSNIIKNLHEDYCERIYTKSLIIKDTINYPDIYFEYINLRTNNIFQKFYFVKYISWVAHSHIVTKYYMGFLGYIIFV